MSGDDLQPDPPDHLLRWDENLAEHVDVFPPQTPPGEASFDTLKNILRTIAQWYVRKDGKYYDVEEFGPVFSRDDVERIIVQRLKGTCSTREHPSQRSRLYSPCTVAQALCDDATCLKQSKNPLLKYAKQRSL